MSEYSQLSRRERQIMEAVYRLGRATVSEVVAHISDPPSYSTVRALINVLEEKGHLRHEQDGPRYVYLPTVGRDKARRSALKSLVSTFFDGSSREAIAALLELPESKLSKSELEELSRLLQKAKKEGR